MTASDGIDPVCAYYLRAFTRAEGWTLDVGCGRALYHEAVAGHYVGADMCPKPFAPEAGRRFFVEAPGDKLPFAAETFDLVLVRSAFYQFPRPDEALVAFRAVLKPGGRVLLFDYNRRAQRRLQVGEGAPRPCWTQWQLRDRVARAGFRAVEILAPKARRVGMAERWLRLLHQEWFGSWAIVTGLK